MEEAPLILDKDLLAEYQKTLIEMAQDRLIKELRVSGEHIENPFIIHSHIDFVVIPAEGMTVWHARSFEKMASFLLKKIVKVFTAKELKNETENAMNLEEFIEKYAPSPPRSPTRLKLIEDLGAILRKDERIWQGIQQNPGLLIEVGYTITLEFLADHKESILTLAERYSLSEIKVFGKCVRQKFYSSTDLTFLILPNQKIHLYEKSAFENALRDLLQRKLYVFTAEDLEEYIKHDLATQEQVTDYREKSINIKDLVKRENTSTDRDKNTVSSHSNSPTFGKM